MAKNGRAVTRSSRLVLKPQGPGLSKRAVHKFYALLKIQKYVQLIVHNGKARGHTAVYDTGALKYMIGRDGFPHPNPQCSKFAPDLRQKNDTRRTDKQAKEA